MHELRTTDAFVMNRYPHGESNFTYKLLTEEFGLLYAHGQGVRELKSRNKYALKTGQLLEVTLVRGREVWRITGAVGKEGEHALGSLGKRRVLHTTGKLLAPEDGVKGLFKVLRQYAMHGNENEDIAEALVMLRVMDKLGFVARPLEEQVIAELLETVLLDAEVFRRAEENKTKLVARVNSALREAL